MLRAVSWFTMVGAIVGGAVGSVAGFRWALWYFSPGNSAQVQAALCPCLANAQDAIETFIRSQVIGAVFGVILFNVVGIFVRRNMARRAAIKRAPQTPGVPL